MYQARILDKNRKLKAVLPGVRWHYTRRINEATSIEIYIPREVVDERITQSHVLYGFFAPAQPVIVEPAPRRVREDKTKYAEIASYVQIYKGDKLKASGKIVGRTLGQVVTVEAYTEEILLETSLTPSQYGKVWDGWDLADVARDLLDGWQTMRVKAPEQWQQYMVDSHRVDLTTEPGTVMLAKRASGQYYDSGYITLVFNKSEIPNFKAWDRVRWSADSEEPVKTSIQISTNGTSFSAPFDGGLPEEIGYYIGGDHDQVWVRINLSTSDTESEDPEGNPVGVTPTVFAVELIARTEGDLAVGNIPAVAGATVKGLSADHASAFRVLVDACDQVGWEFQVVNGALNIAENLGVDRTKDFVFRAGSNIEIQTLGDGDDDLVNILTAYGPGRGINRMEITLRDEASIAEYGEYPAAVEFDAEKLDELEQKAQEFLSEHNSPKTQFEIAVAFEHDKEPDYGLGDKVRVADPETGIVTTTRIMAEAREYNEQGLSVHLELGKAGFILAEAISGEKRVAKPLDPLQPSGVYARGVIAGLVVGCAVPKIDWAYTECHLSTASGFSPSSSTLRTSGRQNRFDIMELTPGVRYYAKLVHVDSDGRRSDPSQEVSAVAAYMQPEMLPDHSIGVEKFMGTVKPPIMVTSKPDFPDPHYPSGSLLYYTQERRLYEVDATGTGWELLNAGQMVLDELVAGIIETGGIKADWYAEVRNTWTDGGHEPIAPNYPIEYDFHLPSETDKIVSIMLSAKGTRFRAYAVGAASGGGDVVTSEYKGGHTHSLSVAVVNVMTEKEELDIKVTGGRHDHPDSFSASVSEVPVSVVRSLVLNADGSHDHEGHTLGVEITQELPINSVVDLELGDDGEHSHNHTLGVNIQESSVEVVVGIGTITDGDHSHGHSFAVSISETPVRVIEDLVLGSAGGHTHSVADIEVDLMIPLITSYTANKSDINHDHWFSVSISGDTEWDQNHYHGVSLSDSGYTSNAWGDPQSYVYNLETDWEEIDPVTTVSGSLPITGSHGGHVALIYDGNHTHQVSATLTGSITFDGSHGGHVSNVDKLDHAHGVQAELTGGIDPGGSHGGHVVDISKAIHTHGVQAELTGSIGLDGTHSGHVQSYNVTSHEHEVEVSIEGSVDYSETHEHIVTVTGTTTYLEDETGLPLPVPVNTHVHKFSYRMLGSPSIVDGSHDHDVEIPDHVHELVYGIYEDTTPNNVMLYVDDGNGYGTPISLNAAPDQSTPYTLCTELDLTNLFSLPEKSDPSEAWWKRIKFESDRLGRINYQLVFKMDITA